jgi:hypothetical protein
VNQTKIEELVEGEDSSEDKPNGNEEEKNKKFVEPEKSGE